RAVARYHDDSAGRDPDDHCARHGGRRRCRLQRARLGPRIHEMTRLAALALVAILGLPAHLLADSLPPKLVVVIVVDQMRRDYVADYGSHWTRGLRRIFDQGAWFTEAAYPYLTTLTCPGHATISTGTLPSTHGIINNQWWDRESQQLISCSND